MSLKDQLESDIYTFFDNIEKQDPEDRKKTLKALLEKYAHISTVPCVLTKTDFDVVKDIAHNFFVKSAFPKQIGPNRREVHSSEGNVLAIIEGTISMLNSNDCFKRLPRFDYRD
jgi:hypothetical protein